MSFIEKVKTSKKHLVYLVRGKADGKPCWHYVLVDKLKLSIFEQKLKLGNIDVADYGQILASGWGENPPAEVEAKIKQDFS